MEIPAESSQIRRVQSRIEGGTSMRRTRNLLAGVASLAVLYLLSSRSASAGVINIIDGIGVSWEVSCLPPEDLTFTPTTPATGNRNTVGVLTDNTIRTTLAPLTIHFIQTTEAPMEGNVTGGLRILLQTHIVNDT